MVAANRTPSRREILRYAPALSAWLAAGGCSSRTTSNQERGADPVWAERYSDLLERTVQAAAKHSVPGVSIAVVRNAQIVWSPCVGVTNSSSKAPVSEQSVFEAASMSKPVFAYAVMKLHERGTLDLDRPLTAYTPVRFLAGDARLDRITARHVLSHTSGLPDIRSRRHPLRIDFEPGTKWQYSGEGYAYLQSVVTRLKGQEYASPCGTYETDLKVCGTDFDSYMKANVLQPLGMNSSGYLWHENLANRLVYPHDAEGKPMPVRKYTSADAARYGSMGGLLTTAQDYARFLIAMLDPGKGDAFRLRKETIAEMLRPQIKVQDGPGFSIFWASGWKIAKTSELGELVSHGGDQPGFHSLAEMSPARKSGYVILTNGENGWKLIQEIAPEFSRRIHAPA
jgi:CubicO group peptidase (beta-lactamase class C family)